MNIYVEHDNEWYDLSYIYIDHRFMHCDYIAKSQHINPALKTDKRDFEIGSRVYFEDISDWVEVSVKGNECGDRSCVYYDKHGEETCIKKHCIGPNRKDKTTVYFKKLELTEKHKDSKIPDQFYVLNTKTGVTNFIHGSEESARTESERLASKQPGDVFRVLKVVGECTGKVKIEWK